MIKDRKKHFGTPQFTTQEEDFSNLRYCLILRHKPDFFNGKIIADMGCGWGSGAKHLIKAGAKQVFAFDINPEAIQIANKHYADAKITYQEKLIHNTGLSNQSVDIVQAVEIIEHVDTEELNLALTHWHNILKEGGHLYITTPEIRRPKSSFPQGSHWTEYAFDELNKIVSKIGFKYEWSIRKAQTDGVTMAFLFQKTNKNVEQTFHVDFLKVTREADNKIRLYTNLSNPFEVVGLFEYGKKLIMNK